MYEKRKYRYDTGLTGVIFWLRFSNEASRHIRALEISRLIISIAG